ncbi:ribbon-helix-helix domain-containing protein [Sulfurisphaera ohwakuensis]|uniref:ribbon-helix-helix domain-containing protein n=1 Tax=Sulfurisphaera ohwakuensis TaxID=69656 RepID=UPI0036F30276
MRVVTFKIDEELLEMLDSICVKNKVERSVIIRQAISEFLAKHYFNENVPKAKVTKIGDVR